MSSIATVSKNARGDLLFSRPNTLDAVATTVELTLAGPPVVIEPVVLIQPRSDESYGLSAAATLEGDTISLEGEAGRSNIGHWTNSRDSLLWRVVVPDAGTKRYLAQLEYSCEPGREGSTIALLVDGKDTGLTATIEKTNGWDDYRSLTLSGTLFLTGGPHTISIRPKTKPGLAVMNFHTLQLKPAAP